MGEYVNISGSKGNKNTFVTLKSADATLFPTGFAGFEGPFLLPPESASTSIEFSLIPKSGSPYPVLENTLPVPLEKNKRTEITLWLNSVYQFIEITVVTAPISDEDEGEIGLWQ
ncbi:MAG: hypothetical protein LIO93_10370 [Bacteroidales bacterium]|nr:hypothetical protein [Bacteroidales bacterium]